MSGTVNHQSTTCPPPTASSTTRTSKFLLRISHLFTTLVLLLHIASKFTLPERSLVVLLNQAAAATAAGDENVRNTAALQIIFPAHVTALNGSNRQRQEGNKAGSNGEQAARVEPVETLKRAILVQAVVDTAKENAWAECSDEAWK